MPIESATNPGELNPLWPLGTDPKSEGDNHLRLLKQVLQGWAGPTLKDEAELEAWVNAQITALGGGGGYFAGNNGRTGPAENVADIFRVHGATITADITIAAGEHALACGPLTVADGITLQIDGVAAIV